MLRPKILNTNVHYIQTLFMFNENLTHNSIKKNTSEQYRITDRKSLKTFKYNEGNTTMSIQQEIKEKTEQQGEFCFERIKITESDLGKTTRQVLLFRVFLWQSTSYK